MPPAVKLAAALRAQPALTSTSSTPRFPVRRPCGPACLVLRSQRIQVWLKDESLEDSANLPDPGVLALEITEDLEGALAQFAQIATDLKR